jgi:NADPH:quinone reductase-like Zn-dependent oxidoreductase
VAHGYCSLPAARIVDQRGLAQGRLKPVIAKTFPLGRIVDAHRYPESNQQFGKIVVTV